MKNNVLRYLSLFLLVLATNSCTEEFLDVQPIAAENSAAFYKTMQHADQAIIACYSQFNNTAAWDRSILMAFGDVTSDDCEAGGDFVNEVPEFEGMNRLIPDPSVEMYDQAWGSLYRGINFANIALENLPSIAETDPDVDLKLLNMRMAEAKFIRAINHFYATIVFGEVPLVDHVLGPSEYEMGRSSIRDVFNLIEKDLLEAMEVLPERGGWNGEEGRATRGACQALLARMYLYESSYAKHYAGQDPRYAGLNERWADALKYAELVINSGKYKLVGIDGEKYATWRSPETDGYRYIFTSEGDHSPETVFEITCLQEGLDYNEARGQALTNWTAARYMFLADGSETTTTYWGLGLPTQTVKNLFDPGDPRLLTTMAWEGAPHEQWIEVGGAKRYEMSFSHSVTKTYQRKWECSAAEYFDVKLNWNTAPSNVKLIRFADVYLIAGEAALMLGQNDKALNYVNKVRERARNCGTSGQPAALTSISLDDIVKERRLEFTGEGHRMFDIVRWNKAFDLLNTETTDGYQRLFIRGKHEYQPIPQREIDLSGGNISQY
ncbi:MAG: RagB/SusD family nutrient uptake outer membrane protein [Prolixibacteraceae bacterium]|nr:RagB/SusD family nutrient uptake outer membrane protein [Prolixibacteraceae bacterium]